MKLVIDISDKVYKCVMDGTWCGSLYDELKNGVPVEPCADCVSRESVKKLLNEGWLRGIYPSSGNIDAFPSVTPERKPGKWKWNQRTGEYECSECGCNPIYERTTPDVSEIDKYRYCRWCGAPMEVNA